MVRWMSGLVNGLQNRVRRFDPATHLKVGGKSFDLSPTFLLVSHPSASTILQRHDGNTGKELIQER